MKIASVAYANHPILGNLRLNFENAATRQPYSNIVLAGENGVGKSTILKTLNTFLCVGPITPFAEIIYVTTDGKYKAIPDDRSAIDSFHKRIDMASGLETRIGRNNHNDREGMLADSKDPRSYGSVLSQARSDFKTKRIEHSSSKELDTDLHEQDSEDDFTSLKQLLVDINTSDNEEYSRINDVRAANGEEPMSKPEFETTHSKIYRFKKAFNDFFENIEFVGINTRDGNKVIEFKKGTQTISIDDLSTGEKQIVFRGAHLLKNLSKLTGATIFIDEPELSMHPLWQQKILGYYKNLFTDNAGNQIAQLFFCTHSERVITEALQTPDTLVIVLSNENGHIIPNHITSPGVLPSITDAETNYLAFKVYTTDYHIQLYGWLQNKEGLTSVSSCDIHIKNHLPEYDATIHRKASSHGRTNYETLPTYIRNAIHHPDSGNTYTQDELRISTELLRSILSVP